MPSSAFSRFWLISAIAGTLMAAPVSPLQAQDLPSSARRTPLVEAIAQARPSVVNIRGSKTVPDDTLNLTNTHQTKQVNGMGTGIVIDSRGYILTNYHVVEDVTQIRVSTSTRETVVGQLIAHDQRTDLALLKIETREPLPVIPLGLSSNVMLAESVAAIGNAYGYEHTVTVGIVSELGRTVQVSDEQIYYDLIQTDASINPGNSGGPLLNLDGEMIGINVAVRVGAQGIAFAIPTDEGIEVAAELMRQVVSRSIHHGLTVATRYHDDQPTVAVVSVDPLSAAAEAGIQPGDRIVAVGGTPCARSLDVYRGLVERTPAEVVTFEYQRGDKRLSTAMNLKVGAGRIAQLDARPNGNDLAWSMLGIEVSELPRDSMHRINGNYDGGLRIVQIRPNSPAERENMRVGDVIVAMSEWKTETLDNLNYILQQPEIRTQTAFKFYIFRNSEPLYGQIRIASVPN